MPPSGELNSPLQIQTDPLPTIGARSRQIPERAVVAQSCLTAATKVIDTLPSPSGEGGPRPALSPAGVGRACAHRRSLTLQSFSDGAAPARRRVRGSPKSLPKKQDFTTLQCSVRLVTLRPFRAPTSRMAKKRALRYKKRSPYRNKPNFDGILPEWRPGCPLKPIRLLGKNGNSNRKKCFGRYVFGMAIERELI